MANKKSKINISKNNSSKDIELSTRQSRKRKIDLLKIAKPSDSDEQILVRNTPKKRKLKESKASPQKISNENPTTSVQVKASTSKVTGTKLQKVSKSINTKIVTLESEGTLIKRVATEASINLDSCKNIINLFKSDATIPFMVRYRGHLTGEKTAEQLRKIKEIYSYQMQMREKAKSVVNLLSKCNLLTDDLIDGIISAQSIAELNDIAEPFKGTRKSSIQLANDINLSQRVKEFLHEDKFIDLTQFINPNINELKTLNLVNELFVSTMCNQILNDVELATKLKDFYDNGNIFLTSKKINRLKNATPDTASTFTNYYNYSTHLKYVKPFHVLAINRGEELKILRVDLDLPNSVGHKCKLFLTDKWCKTKNYNTFRYKTIENVIKNQVMPKLEKKIKKRLRNELSKTAESAAIDVFSSNLKWLLLSRPILNRNILAIDPGYNNGCKIAVLAKSQEILDTAICHLNNKTLFQSSVMQLIETYSVTLIGIGNGTACRSVEGIISEVILKFKKKSGTIIRYLIVPEQGTSVYSCSSEARAEYHDLSPLLISAVSIGKRLIDPLGEYSKVEPRHLGVGMYQHDINPKRLDECLKGIISEVVSIIGVDVNTAPLHILKQVSGLTESRARNIITYRSTKGPITCRQELVTVKGIGTKSFEQCCGFVRVAVDGSSIKEPLDQTIIHPEHYKIANRFITEICNLDKKQIGEERFINEVKRVTQLCGKESLCKTLNLAPLEFNLIFDGLTRSLDYDIRSETAEPLYRSEIKSFSELKIGQTVTGRVNNVTHFGSFVDVGIGKEVLLPIALCNKVDLHYGQRVSVLISELDPHKEQVSARLLNVLSK